MDETQKFVVDIQEKQQKNLQNQKRQGKGNPGSKLPNKQHSTNK